MRDIMQSDKLFSGNFVLFGGDFRKVLPVVPKGSRANIVGACIFTIAFCIFLKSIQILLKTV